MRPISQTALLRATFLVLICRPLRHRSRRIRNLQTESMHGLAEGRSVATHRHVSDRRIRDRQVASEMRYVVERRRAPTVVRGLRIDGTVPRTNRLASCLQEAPNHGFGGAPDAVIFRIFHQADDASQCRL